MPLLSKEEMKSIYDKAYWGDRDGRLKLKEKAIGGNPNALFYLYGFMFRDIPSIYLPKSVTFVARIAQYNIGKIEELIRSGKGVLTTNTLMIEAEIIIPKIKAEIEKLREIDDILKKADGALAMGNKKFAITALKDILNKVPEHAKALIGLCECLGDDIEAIKKEMLNPKIKSIGFINGDEEESFIDLVRKVGKSLTEVEAYIFYKKIKEVAPEIGNIIKDDIGVIVYKLITDFRYYVQNTGDELQNTGDELKTEKYLKYLIAEKIGDKLGRKLPNNERSIFLYLKENNKKDLREHITNAINEKYPNKKLPELRFDELVECVHSVLYSNIENIVKKKEKGQILAGIKNFIPSLIEERGDKLEIKDVYLAKGWTGNYIKKESLKEALNHNIMLQLHLYLYPEEVEVISHEPSAPIDEKDEFSPQITTTSTTTQTEPGYADDVADLLSLFSNPVGKQINTSQEQVENVKSAGERKK